MAQVIKHGKFYREPKKEIPLDKRKYTLVCKKCKCEFSFMGSEANLIESLRLQRILTSFVVSVALIVQNVKRRMGLK